SSKSKANQSKGKGRETEESKSKDTETVESAKSYQVKKFLAEIRDSVKSPQIGIPFKAWCEDQRRTKYNEVIIQSMPLFLNNGLAKMDAHLTCDEVASAISELLDSNEELGTSYKEWAQTERSKFSRELGVLDEAIDLFAGPMLEAEQQRESEKQSKVDPVGPISAEIASRHKALKDRMVGDDQVAKDWYDKFSDFVSSECFPKTDSATTFKSSLSKIKPGADKSSVGSLGSRLSATYDIFSGTDDLMNAYTEWHWSVNPAKNIKSLQSHGQLNSESNANPNSMLGKIDTDWGESATRDK
ncbi:MAG: hypothetical protein TREMPRED_005626, partial [Tremellales sp. Tagirdzhanova-0007]